MTKISTYHFSIYNPLQKKKIPTVLIIYNDNNHEYYDHDDILNTMKKNESSSLSYH